MPAMTLHSYLWIAPLEFIALGVIGIIAARVMAREPEPRQRQLPFPGE